MLELGVPFSDPVADGPVIQQTTERALEAGATPARVLTQALLIRSEHETPLVLMSYLNPILRHGAARFAHEAREAGVDGVLLVDLPPEEDPPLWEMLRAGGLDTIALVAPTTDPARVPAIAAQARGFLYVAARLGVTGGGVDDPSIAEVLRRCRAHSPLPRCLGFGLGLESDLSRYRGLAEGVIVGSGLLEQLLQAPDSTVREARAREFVKALRAKLPELAPQ